MKQRLAAKGLSLVVLLGQGWGQSGGPEGIKRLDADVIPLPYCMVQEQTSVQHGRNGLVTTSTQKVTHCRDSEGRTRTEIVFPSFRKQVPGGAPVPEDRSIVIVDGPHGMSISCVTDQGQPGTAQVNHFAAEPRHTEAYLQPQVAETWGSAGQRKRTLEPLGRRVIQGVIAEGTREVDEIPAGLLGNNLAYENVYESWISVDFQVRVEGMSDDAYGSRTTTVLKSFTPGEPAANLFEAPPGYVLIDPLAIRVP